MQDYRAKYYESIKVKHVSFDISICQQYFLSFSLNILFSMVFHHQQLLLFVT